MSIDKTMGKVPKIGCIVASAGYVGFFFIVFFEFLSHHNLESKLGYIKGGALGLLSLLVGLISTDFTWRITSDAYSYKNLWIHYVSLSFLRLLSAFFHWKLLTDTRNVKRIQSDLLMKWVQRSSRTRYGAEHRLADIRNVKDFCQLHPLTEYDHYEQYISAIADGECNVMSKQRPYVLAMTSGTSGQPKMLPTVKEQRMIFFLWGILPLFYALFKYSKGIANLQKRLKFFYTPKWRQSKCGIPIGPNSSSPTNSQSELSFHSTPPAAFDILTEQEALYVYLLFGLKDKKLGYLEANFASLVYTALVSLEANWPRLVRDIRNGSIDPSLKIDSYIRRKLEAQLVPDPSRADELQTQFERGFHGIAKQIWPYMNLILCVDSGSFEVYGELLRNNYCKGIRIYSPIYAATEGLLGINLYPLSDERNYMLLPRAMFYEFIPVTDSIGDTIPATLLMHELTLGESYEMVVTNSSGLFRYRFGDVVKVVGFQNEAPMVQFMYRKGQLLNVRGEKTSEKFFYEALLAALTAVCPEYQLIDYCCTEEMASAVKLNCTPRYHVFIELANASSVEQTAINLIAEQLDNKLQGSYVYKSFRIKGSIGRPALSLVSPGTFSDYRSTQLMQGAATPNQFKVPRVIRKQSAIDYMMAAVSIST